jgi:hypothetical protein
MSQKSLSSFARSDKRSSKQSFSWSDLPGNTGATKAAQSVIEIKTCTAPDDASSKPSTHAIDALSSP